MELTSVYRFTRVLGEPIGAEAPHASVCAVSSNSRCEDRLAVHSFGDGDARQHYYAVFDGHGGWECAEFSHNLLSASIAACLHEGKGASVEEDMEEAIACGFQKVEDTWTSNLKNEWLREPNYLTYGPAGTERLSSVGACVLLAIVHKGTLFIANAGDSRAVLSQKVTCRVPVVCGAGQ
jgi:serine/threonine protein phosphatase PrpC